MIKNLVKFLLTNFNDVLHIPGDNFYNKIDKPWKLQFLLLFNMKVFASSEVVSFATHVLEL